MSPRGIAVFAVVAVATLSVLPTLGAATITGSVTAGPGLSLGANGSLTFWVSAPGAVTFTPSISGSSPSCTGTGSWACMFSINDRIIGPNYNTVSSGTASLGGAPADDILTTTVCAGPPVSGVQNCTTNVPAGAQTVSLQLSESVSGLINATGVPGTRTVSVTVSGANVLASPEPGTIGLAALALAGLFAFRCGLR